MISLKARCESLDFRTQLHEVNQLLQNAHVTTTFWGSRIVTANQYVGSVQLNKIADKVIWAACERYGADDFTPSERIAGIEIVRQLKNFYTATDLQLHNFNFFLRALNWIREFPVFHMGISLLNGDGYIVPFRSYSEEKFLHAFGGHIPSDPECRHPAFEFSIPGKLKGAPCCKILVKEEYIRAQLTGGLSFKTSRLLRNLFPSLSSVPK